MPPILIDIETAAAVRLGPGPISALSYRWIRKLDLAGTQAFDTPATDPRASIVAERRYARCHSQIAGTRTEIGLGIIDVIDLDTNQRDLMVSGGDLMRELALRPVGALALVESGETPMTIADALDAIIAVATGWTLDRTTYASATVDVFYTFSDESILAALAKVAALTGTHFRLGTGREIVWLFDAQPSSGIRAVIGVTAKEAEANQDICLITSLSYIRDSSQVISRVYPHGSGTGAARLSLAATTRTAPSGYVLNAAQNYIERTDAETAYGFAARHQSFNDIAPSVPDTDPNYAAAVVSASDTLYDAAFNYLRTNSYPQETYKLSITKLDRLIQPGETIRVIYSGWANQTNEVTGEVTGYKWVDIDADLIVLESTTEITNGGIHMPSLTVATIDRWPVSDLELLVAMAKQVASAQAHDQPVSYSQASGTSGSVTGIVLGATLNAYTTDAESGAYTGIDNAQAGTVYATVADLNALRTAYENLRAMVDDLRTKLQTTGIVG